MKRTPRPLVPVALASSLVVIAAACGGGHHGRSKIEDVPVTQTITLPGLSAPVDVVRDEYGRPHIYGATRTDVAMVTGWVEAEDRMIQLDLARRLAEGRLAELVGAVSPDAADTDAYLRALGMGRAAQATMDAASSNEVGLMNAFSAGVNAKMATFTAPPAPEYVLFGVQPSEIAAWTPLDSAAIGKLFAYSLNWDGETDLALADGLEKVEAAFPTGPRAGDASDLIFPFLPPETISIVSPNVNGTAITSFSRPHVQWTARPPITSLDKVLALSSLADRLNPFVHKHGLLQLDRGSNNWVVSGTKTKSGHPLLCNDPHLSLDAPPIWYPLHLNTAKRGGTLDVEGVAVVGNPAVTLGGNGHVAWAFTNTNPDTSDVYLEKYSAATGSNGADQILWDPDGTATASTAQLMDLAKDDEVIYTRLGDGSLTSSHTIVWRIPWREPGGGVIIPGSVVASTGGGLGTAMSWRWAALQATDEFGALLDLNDAQSVADIHAAADKWGSPTQNWVFADADGHIGYVANGIIPVRDDDDGDLHTDPPQLPMPGDDGAHEWIGRIDRATVPQEDDPARGWIGTANQDPVGFSFDGDPYNDAYYLNAIENDLGFRGARIARVLDAGSNLTVDDMKALQSDDKETFAARMLPFITTALGTNHPDELALLQAWGDRGFRAESGVGDAVPADVVDDSAATSLFEVFMTYLQQDFLGDEMAAAGATQYDDQLFGRVILFVLEHPADAASYDATTGESALWDDVSTTPVETSTEVINTAFDEALAWLASAQGFSSSDPTDWRWGLIHTLTIHRTSGIPLDPIPSGSEYPNGFPRHSGMFAVDVGNGGWSDFDFTYNDGASMREIIDLTPGRMRIYNVLPGGVSADPASPHYDDQAVDYATDTWREVWYRESDVASHAASHVVFSP